MFELIIRGGEIFDGTGAESRKADIGICGGRIAFVGVLDNACSDRTIDASGLCVCPGFIDSHSHTDDWYIHNPFAVSKVLQGVTTEITGNCGESTPLTVVSHTPGCGPGCTDSLRWKAMGEYIREIENLGIGINTASLIGHGSLRGITIGGGSEDPDKPKIEQMQEILTSCLAEGAVGMSTGLIYPPGCFAGEQEIIALCRVLAQYGRVYCTHVRDEGDGVEASISETIRAARMSGVRTVISHHKAKGRKNWGKTGATLAMIEEARCQGLKIYCDVYPYTALSTGLATFLPDWLLEKDLEKTVHRLKAAADSMEVHNAIDQKADCNYDSITITKVSQPHNKFAEGKTVSDLALVWGIKPSQAVLRLLIDEQARVGMVHHAMSEEDVINVLQYSATMIGSDAGARISVGPLAAGLPHPRAYGTFPRVIARYVRDKKVLDLKEAIRKMTSLPAAVFNLVDRGKIMVGYHADITIFNYATIEDKATFQQPFRPPEGIDYVLINGVPVVWEGKLTYSKAGHFIKGV